jgi:type IV pilus assembly protein PilF
MSPRVDTLLRALLLAGLSALLLACTSAQERQDLHDASDINVRLGVGYLQKGRLDDALVKLRKALEQASDNAQAHSSIALVYEQSGKQDEAREHYEEALDLNPEDGATRNNYAALLCRSGEPQAAEPHFLRAIQTRGYRTRAQALENLGVCAMQIPDLEKAENYLRQALKIDPRLSKALLQMARLSAEKQQYLSGRAYLQRYQAVKSMTPAALWLGIHVEKKLGNAAQVSEYETRLLRRFPNARETRWLLEARPRQRGP